MVLYKLTEQSNMILAELHNLGVAEEHRNFISKTKNINGFSFDSTTDL